ncbi:unnamed protein product [Caenorhabditis brenneri]
MKILTIFLILAIFAFGTAQQFVADQPAAFMDHGEVIVEDKPDIPGNISGPDGSPPTHVTYSDPDQDAATTKRIYQ